MSKLATSRQLRGHSIMDRQVGSCLIKKCNCEACDSIFGMALVRSLENSTLRETEIYTEKERRGTDT